MSLFRKCIIWGGSLFWGVALSGCWQQRPSYSYLMLHPAYLQQQYNHCVGQVVDPSLPCETILRAQADFTALTNEREQDPERFGARIMQEQENVAYFKAQFDAAWRAYRQVGASKPSLEELKNSRMELDKRKADYLARTKTVEVLLSVIAATSMV